MSQRIHSFLGQALSTRNGELGSVKDFLFDDRLWEVRYLVVETGSWLSSRQVLISPEALVEPSQNDGALTVELTQEQVRNAPGTDMAQPVSRRHEEELRQYYGWPLYWTDTHYLTSTGGFAPSFSMDPIAPMGPMDSVEPQALSDPPAEERRAAAEDSHLRSVAEVNGYHIHARDGEIGHVEDFVVEDDKWVLSHLIVDTRNWLPGRKVVVPLDTVLGITWEERSVNVDLPREVIENGPVYDPDEEMALHAQVLSDYYKGLH